MKNSEPEAKSIFKLEDETAIGTKHDLSIRPPELFLFSMTPLTAGRGIYSLGIYYGAGTLREAMLADDATIRNHPKSDHNRIGFRHQWSKINFAICTSIWQC